MPWVDVYGIYQRDNDLVPMAGESYSDFSTRGIASLTLAQPLLDAAKIKECVDECWNRYIMRSAVEVTLTLKRDIDPNSIYNSDWMDWNVTEIHSATLPTVTFSSVEKAKAGAGDKVFEVKKSKEDKQLVFGWANISKDKDGNFPIDWDGDVTMPEDLEAAAYSYVLKYRTTGEKHEGEAVGELVESVMFTKEKQAALGIPDGIMPEGWWVGFHIPDAEVFAKIKSGEYEMFSVQGSAKRAPTGQ